MANNQGGFGTSKTRFIALVIGFFQIDACLFMSIFTKVETGFLYKMAALAVGLSGLYITGRSATHFAKNNQGGKG